MAIKPAFPITITFFDDNTTCVYSNENELECDLEWFDSEDPEWNTQVVDALNREVILMVEALELKIFELKDIESIAKPFILSEHGDLMFFDSIDDMGGYAEAFDVANNEYEFFDAKGEKIIKNQRRPKKYFFGLFSMVDCSPISFTASGKNEAIKLKKLLVAYCNRVGIAIDSLSDIPQIIEAMLQSGKVHVK